MSRLLGTRHERSTARDGLLVCSGRIIDASTPRAVGRSRGAFVSVLLGTRHERSTAREMVWAETSASEHLCSLDDIMN